MKCPKCEYKFKMAEVPLEERKFKALYAEFLCPNCRVLLKPAAFQIILINLSIFLFAISGIGLVINVFTTMDINENLISLGFIIAVIVYMLNFKYQKAEVV
jgi:rubredoxin